MKPLRSNSFNEVVLELTDGMGNPMKFNQGNCVVVLYFRKKYEIKKISCESFRKCGFFNSELKK